MSQRTGIRHQGSEGAAGSLCDRCHAPGACCKGFALGKGFGEAGTAEEAERMLGALKTSDGRPLPFKALGRDRTEEHGEFWRWWCPKLGSDGRCTIYNDRPHTCRSYDAGSDRLCAHFRPMDAGDASVRLGEAATPDFPLAEVA